MANSTMSARRRGGNDETSPARRLRLTVRGVRVLAGLCGREPEGKGALSLPLWIVLTPMITVGLPGGDASEVSADPIEDCLPPGGYASPEAAIVAIAREHLAKLASSLSASVVLDPGELARCPFSVELDARLQRALERRQGAAARRAR
jgi:hypothetical protein